MDSSNRGTSSSVGQCPTTNDSPPPALDNSSSWEDNIFSNFVVADGFRSRAPSLAALPGFMRDPADPLTGETNSSSPTLPQLVQQLPESPTEGVQQSSSSSPQTILTSRSTWDLQQIVPPERPLSCSKTCQRQNSIGLKNNGSNNGLADQSGNDPSLQVRSALAEFNQRGPGSPPLLTYTQRNMDGSGDASNHNVAHQGPTHPYSLYPQNTTAGDSTHDDPILIGFPGTGEGYRRQMGPNREDAGGLVGSTGHSEELPPYTEYPEEPRNGESLTSLFQPLDSFIHSSVAQAVPGAGGLGLATRNPEFSSTEDDLTRSQTEQGRGNPSEMRQYAAAPEIREKVPSGKWQQRTKRRAFGIIPYWVVGVLGIGLLLVVIIMGTIAGTILKKEKTSAPAGADDGTYTHGDVSAIVDIEPLPTKPAGTLPLATGLFALPPLDTWLSPRSCFEDSSQRQAWSCDMPLQYFTVDIGTIPNASEVNNHQLVLRAVDGTGSGSKYVWGSKPPTMTIPTRLRLVNDTFDSNLGPAWWAEIRNEKTVIIPEDGFHTEIKRRNWESTGKPLHFDPTQLRRGSSAARAGDRPWICTWPNTMMEMFIYPNKKSTLPLVSAAPAAPTSMVKEIAIDTDPDDDDDDKTQIPVYPQVIKFLERRLEANGDGFASCSQIKILNGSQKAEPVLDDDNLPIVVNITEKQSSSFDQLYSGPRRRPEDSKEEAEFKGSAGGKGLGKREISELTDCGCLWWSL